MQMIITFMAVVAGLVFSVAVALVVEEFIFGQVFRIFFTANSSGRVGRAFAAWTAVPVRVKASQR